MVPAELIARLVDEVRASFRFAPSWDISIETTPKIAAQEPEKLTTWFRSGIRRASMGVQVVQPDLLKLLNREGQGAHLHHRAVENIRHAGFDKLNLDLMYGFADQSVASWRATLEHAIALGPEYVTLYRMRYKLTRISHQAPRVRLEEVRQQAKLAKELLGAAGYVANPGKNTYSRLPGDVGTSDYLRERVVRGMAYLGIGLGAQSFSHATISYNDGAAGKTLVPYFRSVDAEQFPLQDLYHLSLEQVVGKMVAVSFYFGEIDKVAFRERFGESVEKRFSKELDFVLSRGLMDDTGRAFSLTKHGAEHFNGVIALFFAPSIQRYLVERDPDRAEDMHRARKQALRVAGEAVRD
jgi:oxygen-independent coproporphyrinogen-3 oxidase